jgi:two-component system, OmpR family, heavy metal sensor histidine kinase CusS
VKLRSFRLRLAVLSAALAGSALVGFGIVAWRLIYVAKVSRLDAKLENQVRRLARPRPQDWWQFFATTLPRELGTDTDTPIVLWVVGAEGGKFYQSSNGASDLDLQKLLPPPAAVSDLPPDQPNFPRLRHPSETPEFHLERLPDNAPPNLQIVTQRTARGSWRIGLMSAPRTQAAIAVSLQAIDQEMDVIRTIFGVAIPGTLLLVAGGAWALSGSALRPIHKLTESIQQVTVTGLDRQVPLGTTDVEFVELIQVFNQMLERLERSFKQASRFSGDAAHELKTPLAILQGELEQALQQAESGSTDQQMLGTLLDEVRRLSGIVRKLLLLSLADAGQMSFHKVEVNLSDLLSIIVEDLDLLAPHLSVQSDIAPDLRVWGDRDLLTQVLQNLVSNAIKYNLPNGWIRIVGRRQQTTVEVTIANASTTIPVSDRTRIFDRFYRSDPARTRKVEGVGLGLSLAWEIARAHKGDLVLDSTPTGQTALTLTLPTEKQGRHLV